MTTCLKSVESVDESLVDKLIALGIISVLDLDEVGVDPLVKELSIPVETAEKLVLAAADAAKKAAAESKKPKSGDTEPLEDKSSIEPKSDDIESLEDESSID